MSMPITSGLDHDAVHPTAIVIERLFSPLLVLINSKLPNNLINLSMQRSNSILMGSMVFRFGLFNDLLGEKFKILEIRSRSNRDDFIINLIII